INSATTGKVTGLSGSPNRLLYSPLTTTGGGTGGGTAPCTGCTQYTGSLTSRGASYPPHNTHDPTTPARPPQGRMVGPTSGADFDLYLYKWNGSSWVVVASGESTSASETVSYNGTAGYYEWEVRSYSGSGSYSLWLKHP